MLLFSLNKIRVKFMKNKYTDIWKNADWCFQARSIIQGLTKFHKEAKIALFLRHSHRKGSNDPLELQKLGLTTKGHEIAEIFGTSLPRKRSIQIYHSPSPRCQETAERILKGFRKIGGSGKLMGATSPLNNTKSNRGFITTQALKYQGIEFIQRWYDGFFPKDSIILFSDYCTTVYKQIINDLMNSETGGVIIHVSHDLFIIGLRFGLFDRIFKTRWVSFLGGFAVSLINGQNLLLDIGNISVEPIKLWNRNSIPVFTLKMKKEVKNRWEKLK